MNATIVDQIIEACTKHCPDCGGTGSVPGRSSSSLGNGPGVHRFTPGGRCDRCSGKGRLMNEEGRKLAAFLGIQAHNMIAPKA